MKLFRDQAESIHKSKAKINLWHGPVRSAKTVSQILRWIEYIAEDAPPAEAGSKLVMAGKTERTLRANILDPMKDYLGSEFNYSIGSHKADLFGEEIELYGANDERAEEKIRGITCRGAFGDEVSLWPESFFKQLQMRLSVEGAMGFYTTNPGAPKHYLKTDYIDKADTLGINEFYWPIENNVFLPKTYIEGLKQQFTGLYYKRFILGHWVQAEGAIYDFFEEKPPYVISSSNLPKAKLKYGAFDYGTQNAFAFGIFGVNPDTLPRIWLEREYYYSGREQNRQKTDGEYSRDLKEFIGKDKLVKIFGDPSAESFHTQLRRDGFFGVTDADNSVLDGIRTVARLLKNGEFAISDACKHSIEEFLGYVWDPKAAERGEDKPMKVNDHCVDFLRYFLHSMYGKEYLDYTKLTAW